MKMRPGRLYMVVAPTYPLLRDATFRSFREVARQVGQWSGGFNKSEFTAVCRTRFGGHAEVLFRSGDNPDRLRGPNVSGLWMDEASLLKHEAFQISVARLREAGEAGWMTATFTPKGLSHWTYEVFGKPKPGVFLVHARTQDNPFLAEGFLETVQHQFSGLRAAQELGGVFVSVEGAEWPAEYFPDSMWFDDWPEALAIRTSALDPSKGKDAKHGDYSAIVNLGRTADGTLWCEADLANNRQAERIVADAIENQRLFRADGFAVETNQFQELLATQIAKESRAQRIMVPIHEIDNRVNKEVRIRRLGPYLSRRAIRFKADSPGTRLLVEQLKEFPVAEHDDGPDALEMALRLMIDLWNGPGERPRERARLRK